MNIYLGGRTAISLIAYVVNLFRTALFLEKLLSNIFSE